MRVAADPIGDVVGATPESAERRPERADQTRAVDRTAIERLLTRRDIPLREKTLWRMLYETAARAGETPIREGGRRTAPPGACRP